MADLNSFFDWFQASMQDPIRFQVESTLLYREICETTNGWASPMKINVLHNALLALQDNEQYLEIGSYTGRSLAGALLNNTKLAQVIDPFELFLPDGVAIYDQWSKTIQRYGVGDRITLHKALCQNFDQSLPPVGVYYYDGNHDSGHTYEGLVKFERHLTDRAIIIVDDYDIYGGNAQTPYPGHAVDINKPVKTDVDRWLSENQHAQLVAIMPWENSSAVIRYERI